MFLFGSREGEGESTGKGDAFSFVPRQGMKLSRSSAAPGFERATSPESTTSGVDGEGLSNVVGVCICGYRAGDWERQSDEPDEFVPDGGRERAIVAVESPKGVSMKQDDAEEFLGWYKTYGGSTDATVAWPLETTNEMWCTNGKNTSPTPSRATLGTVHIVRAL